jgi:uncharacterized protein Yka (UPF0111/DUF47 family)
MGFINRFLLPRQIDFNAALLDQAQVCRAIVGDLYKACVDDDIHMLNTITTTAQRERELKDENMALLLDTFITPYDKESIYRMITGLDWIALSVKHFQLETHVYQLHSLSEYEPILAVLVDMVASLEEGIRGLPDKKTRPLGKAASRVHDQYDELVSLCATASAQLLAQDDIKRVIRHKDMLLQLKDVARHIHVAANTLEDMAIKVS